MQNSCDKKDERTYAGFWVRLCAYAIDSVIVFLLLLVVRIFMSGVMALVEGTPLGENVLFHYTLKDIVLYVFHVLYFILFTYYTGTTPGKKLLNLRVIGADSTNLTIIDVLYRETIGRFLCGATMNIGYIMAGTDREKRGLHDMLCDTRVIYARKVSVIPTYAQREGSAPYVPEQVAPPMQEIPPQDYNGSYRMVHPQSENEERDS